VLSEIDVSEWEITYKEIRPRKSKRSCDIGKIDQLLEGEARSQVEILGKRKRKKLCIVKKDQQQVSKPKELPPRLCYNCGKPGHFRRDCPTPHKQKQNPESAKGNRGMKPAFQVKQGQMNFMGNISIRERLPTLSFTFKSRDEILLNGGRL
jgi:hypothetical protein